ncbi:tyrosine-type recombinase/integrase [Thermoflexus sp.]|uniref:tyrosine-type recombinase/integrase n=1 Tax=Thermoflexus sp. TaxID=1969742 RepID=UPI002ADDB0E1|nr:site-specific integrase [Thermoflexus sp.]
MSGGKDHARFAPLIETFLHDLVRAGRSPRTIEGYRRDLLDFAAWISGRSGEAFDPKVVLQEDLRDYRQHLLTVRRTSPAIVNRRIAALRAFFAFLLVQGVILTSPAARLNGVEPTRPAPRALSDAELRRLLREARRASNPLRRAVILRWSCARKMASP